MDKYLQLSDLQFLAAESMRLCRFVSPESDGIFQDKKFSTYWLVKSARILKN
jgi:hypothetical protein